MGDWLNIGDIRKISVVSSSCLKEYEVWKEDVVEISNKKTEDYTTWFTYYIYEIIDSWDNIIARIESCPVIIEYKTK